jgi:hypothetical protein
MVISYSNRQCDIVYKCDLGGYGEMLLIGDLILLSGFRIANKLQGKGSQDKLVGLDDFLVSLLVWGCGH